MEKIPAACAMEWSIQLDKTLRSKKPGKSIEALKEIGPHLEWWNSESKPALVAEYRMFGLIPGEDKLFLNSIFLRLTDAFRLGDTQIKNRVVKLFLRVKRRKKRDDEGILSKGKLENYLELLRRVKEVFDNGDVEERALALMLFGCWADFAKDSTDVRYIVLSSLVSDHVLEPATLRVKASLFAAECLSELSDDFGNVFLEILTTMLASPNVSMDVKLLGGRAFGKMWYSFSLADKAYKTGLKLLMASAEDDFSAVMLISLSRIAFRWMALIPTQLKLLTTFLSEDRTLHMQATSLKCHLFILAKGVWNFPSSTDTVQNLFGMLHRTEFPVTLQLEAFKILHKILPLNLSTIPSMEMSELFLKLLEVVGNMVQSSIVSTRVLAVNILADLSGKLLGRTNLLSDGTGSSLACQLISFALDRILFLLTPKVVVHQTDFTAEFEIKSLLDLLFILVEKHSYLCCIVMKKICLFISKLMNMFDKVAVEEIALSNHELIKSKLMLYVSKILVACLQNLEETDAEIYHVLDALKLQAENVSQCSYFGGYTSTTYFLLLHLHASYIRMRHMDEKLVSIKSSLSCVDSLLHLDMLTIDCAKKMLGRNNYWSSYKTGKIAACQGAWSTAAFIFEQLIDVVQSASFFCWMKSLAQFSTSEKQIQLLFSFDQSTSSCPVNLAEIGGISSKIDHNYMEILLRAHNALLSSEELLASSEMGHMFSFQIWFLTLRRKVVKTVVDIMNLLDTVLCIRDGPLPSVQLESSVLLPCNTSHRLSSLICNSTEISYQMKKLAQELDLLLMSFIGMDRQSVIVLSSLALSCSLLAFSANFAFQIPNLHSSKIFQILKSENTEDTCHALLVEDLAGRLRHTDSNTRTNLQFLLKSSRNCNSFSFPRFQTQICSTGFESRVLRKLCEDSIRGIATLQKEATQVPQDGDAAFQIINDGSRLLLNIILKWMLTPFRTPHHFFRVRPPVSSELFVKNEDGKDVDGISILPGFHLSLSLCFQLKNMPSCLPAPPTKVFCILNCKTHSQMTAEIGVCKRQSHFSRQDQEMDDMVSLNEKLLRHAIGSGGSSEDKAGDCCTVNEYVCFELNERGQGFSTCLLDVSAFPMGSYRIKWHSGFIDSRGSYWSPLPLNAGPLFTVHG